MTIKQAYANTKSLIESYAAAETSAEKESIKARFDELEESIENEGRTFSELFRFYEKSMNNGNEMMNIDDLIRSDVTTFIAQMILNGVTEFTFTSTWSSATEVIAAFIDAGFQIKQTASVCTNKTKWDEDYKTGLVFERR